jgi:hypothetical protein
MISAKNTVAISLSGLSGQPDKSDSPKTLGFLPCPVVRSCPPLKGAVEDRTAPQGLFPHQPKSRARVDEDSTARGL